MVGTQLSLRVEGKLVAGASHELTDRELLSPSANLLDDARERVTQRRIGVQTVHRLLVGRERALLLDRLEHLLHLVGPGSCLANQRQLGLSDLHQLGSGGDQGVERSHEHPSGGTRRSGRVYDGKLP